MERQKPTTDIKHNDEFSRALIESYGRWMGGAGFGQHLVEEGIPAEHLSAIGFGEFRPVASNDTVEGRRQNRRVKVVILADKNSRRAATIDGASSNTDLEQTEQAGG